MKEFFNSLGYFIGGIASIGIITASLNNSIIFWSPSGAILAVFITSLIWIGTTIGVRKIKPTWGTGENKQILTKLKKKHHLFFLGVLAVLLYSILFKPIKEESRTNFVCDRDIHSGCDLNFRRPSPKKDYILATYNQGHQRDNSYRIYSSINIISGGEKQFAKLPIDSILWNKIAGDSSFHNVVSDTIYFPNVTTDKKINSPYSMYADSSRLKFYGKIFDYKSGELLGWFDDNEFGVVESCSFSWNKDCTAFEIIDKYDNVCFSIELFNKQEILKFKGFFKQNDTYIIVNDSIKTTKDIVEAEKLIKAIKPVFDHYGKNSTGKRI